MRFKTLVEPTGIMQKGDEWISPEGHSPAWRRVWNGTAFVEDLKAAGFPMTELSPTLTAEELAKVGADNDTDETEETEDTTDSDEDEQQPPTEDSEDEQGMQAEVSDRDGGEQGASGESGSEPKQRGKRGKVRKGGKGK